MKNLTAPNARIALAATLALGSVLAALPAMAKQNQDTQHLRGQITAVSDSGFTMTTNDGTKRQIRMSPKTRISAVTRGDLSHIKKGTFIGTANVKEQGRNRALEMVIFPPSMKGTGLGDYGWDLTPAMANQSATVSQNTQSGASKTAAGSSMTNGTVTSESSTPQSGGSMTSGSSMTNGTVSSKSSGSGSMSSGSSMTNGTVSGQSDNGQTMTLTVDYGQGSKKIVVPSDVPTVKVQPGQKSDLKKGAHVFVAGPKTSGTFNAKMVIVGKNGTIPPM